MKKDMIPLLLGIVMMGVCTEQECVRQAEAMRVRYVNPLKIETGGGCVHDLRYRTVFLVEMKCEKDSGDEFKCLVC